MSDGKTPSGPVLIELGAPAADKPKLTPDTAPPVPDLGGSGGVGAGADDVPQGRAMQAAMVAAGRRPSRARAWSPPAMRRGRASCTGRPGQERRAADTGSLTGSSAASPGARPSASPSSRRAVKGEPISAQVRA